MLLILTLNNDQCNNQDMRLTQFMNLRKRGLKSDQRSNQLNYIRSHYSIINIYKKFYIYLLLTKCYFVIKALIAKIRIYFPTLKSIKRFRKVIGKKDKKKNRNTRFYMMDAPVILQRLNLKKNIHCGTVRLSNACNIILIKARRERRSVWILTASHIQGCRLLPPYFRWGGSQLS